jgi:hypothetical protein
MITAKKIVYDIIDSVSNFIVTDDNRFLDYERILDKVYEVRASIIKDEGILTDEMFSDMCCLEVQCDDVVCNNVSAGETRYYIDIPDTVKGSIRYLGLADWKTPFTNLGMTGMIALDGNEWTASMPGYYLSDGRAYLYNLPTDGIRYLCLSAVFENPQDMCDYDDEKEFPFPMEYIHKLKLLVKKDILSTYNVPVDKEQNASDDAARSTQQVSPQQ